MTLAREAELERLSRLLRCKPKELGRLDRFESEELRPLRMAIAQRLYDDHKIAYQRIAAASRLIPMRILVPLVQRLIPPRLAADIVATLPPTAGAAMARRLPADYCADVTTYLLPQAIAPVIEELDMKTILAITAELTKRKDYATMAEMLIALDDEQLVGSIDAIDDGEAITHVALRVTDLDAIDRITDVLPDERLQQIVRYGRKQAGLWTELMALLSRVPNGKRKKLLSAALS